MRGASEGTKIRAGGKGGEKLDTSASMSERDLKLRYFRGQTSSPERDEGANWTSHFG